MQPAEVAASMDAPNKLAQRTNRGFADATCNLVTGVMLPLEPNGYSNCTEGARTVLFAHVSHGKSAAPTLESSKLHMFYGQM